MAANADNSFYSAIRESFKHWSVIQIAKQHGFGGTNADAKEEWLNDSVFQIFHDNGLVYPDELEDFISEVLFNEFDTITEDGSVGEMCKRLCSYYELCKAQKYDEVIHSVNLLSEKERKKAPITLQKDDESDGELQNNENTAKAPATKTVDDRIDAGNSMEVDEQHQQDIDDGWQVVRKSKKK